MFTHAAPSLTPMHGASPSIYEGEIGKEISSPPRKKDGRLTDERAEMKLVLGQPERGRRRAWKVEGGREVGRRTNKWPEESHKIDNRTEETDGERFRDGGREGGEIRDTRTEDLNETYIFIYEHGIQNIALNLF